MKSVISCVEPFSFPFKTLDPFLFCVYHKDHYPAGDEKMQAPRRGNGADFNPTAPYRMYHGDRIPGFPQHPHRGFETVTATLAGTIDHTDSCGNAGRYGQGDLQWMTAGKGVVHGENFPLVNKDAPNTLVLFQIWLNLPKKSKMVDPAFAMHWKEDIPRLVADNSRAKVTVWAGTLEDKTGLPPPPNSYGSTAESELGIWFIELAPGGTYTIPPAAGGDAINRMLYFTEGDSLSINAESIKKQNAVTLRAGQSAELHNPHSTASTEILILQGRPIGEPVAQQGPFVMNTQAELQQAFSDYRRTEFGGWPWPDNAVVFPREKGRFALLDGKEFFPPSQETCDAAEK